MLKIKLLVSFTAFSACIFGQTNYEKFKKLYNSKDTAKLRPFLAEWERSNPDDPELYTSAFNYYFNNSSKEIVHLDRTQQKKESFQLTDKSGKVTAYISASLDYNKDILSKALSYANAGIEKFPNRLDIRFGKCYVLGQIGDYENFTNEIIKTVEYSNTIKNNWLWTENKKLDNAEKYMLDGIHGYLKQLYDTEDDNLLENMKRIGDFTLQYYQNSIEVLTSTAIAHLLTKNYDKAIGYLKQAEKLNPKDTIVLNNIAHGYKLKGDKENAIKYYELMEKYGDEETKQAAKKYIKELKK